MPKIPVFGSLGSNYSGELAALSLASLLETPDPVATRASLNKQLHSLFPNHQYGPYYFLQGRQALEASLLAWKIGAGDGVITQAFSCFAIESAIEKTGATAVYADVAPDSTNLTVATLTAAYDRAQVPVKAVIVQHSLGVAAHERAIRTWCDRHEVLLISDLAQGFGGRDEGGAPLGSTADAVLLSFGRDKILDGVLGGAVLFRTEPAAVADLERFKELTSRRPVLALLYPGLTWLIRKTWQWGVGKYLLAVSSSAGVIQSPVLDASTQLEALPSSTAALVLHQLTHLTTQLEQRQKIAALYWGELNTAAVLTKDELSRSCMLRFPIRVPAVAALVTKLRREEVFLSDRWYTQPLDSGRLQQTSNYQSGECPVTEQLVTEVINLPTHQAVTINEAKRIIRVVKEHVHG